MIIETRQLTSILASLILAVLVAGREARADILITIEQSGNNVVETGSGAANTTGLTLEFTVGQGALIIPGLAIAVVGEVDSAATIFSGATGPASFGTSSNPVDPTSGTGDTFGIEGNSGVLALPAGYVSGTQLSGSTTFAGTNFTQMALTAGTYTYTWGTGSDQSLTVQIGPAASAVPRAIHRHLSGGRSHRLRNLRMDRPPPATATAGFRLAIPDEPGTGRRVPRHSRYQTRQPSMADGR